MRERGSGRPCIQQLQMLRLHSKSFWLYIIVLGEAADSLIPRSYKGSTQSEKARYQRTEVRVRLYPGRPHRL